MERVPTKAAEFDPYIKNGDDYLNESLVPPVMNYTRLCLSLIIAGLWHTQRLAWDILYAKYTDPLRKTTAVVKAVNLFIVNFKIFSKPHLDTMAACAGANSDDEAMYNFVRDAFHAEATHHEDGISDEIFTKIIQAGGGNMQAKGYASTAAKRAGCPKDKGIDSVRRYYSISTTEVNGPANYNEAGVISEVRTGATSVLKLGADKKGKYLNYWDQWYDTKHPDREGPLSDKQVKLIV